MVSEVNDQSGRKVEQMCKGVDTPEIMMMCRRQDAVDTITDRKLDMPRKECKSRINVRLRHYHWSGQQTTKTLT